MFNFIFSLVLLFIHFLFFFSYNKTNGITWGGYYNVFFVFILFDKCCLSSIALLPKVGNFSRLLQRYIYRTAKHIYLTLFVKPKEKWSSLSAASDYCTMLFSRQSLSIKLFQSVARFQNIFEYTTYLIIPFHNTCQPSVKAKQWKKSKVKSCICKFQNAHANRLSFTTNKT